MDSLLPGGVGFPAASALGCEALLLDRLRRADPALPERLLIHSDWLSAYGLRPETLHSFSRMTLSARQRFTAILECEKLSLALPGPPARGDLCSTAAL